MDKGKTIIIILKILLEIPQEPKITRGRILERRRVNWLKPSGCRIILETLVKKSVFSNALISITENMNQNIVKRRIGKMEKYFKVLNRFVKIRAMIEAKITKNILTLNNEVIPISITNLITSNIFVE